MNRPVRVLEVVGGMDVAGVETYLLHVARRVDRDRLAMDFVVNEAREYPYESELRSLGSHFHRASVGSAIGYAQQFLRVLDDHGPYDVVHTHVHFFGALPLFLARQRRVPVRIAQSHNTNPPAPVALARRAYRAGARGVLLASATHLCAVTGMAARALFGASVESDARYSLLPCGVDLSRFAQNHDSAAARKLLGLAPDDFVVGHIGRLHNQKNHEWLIEVALRLKDQVPHLQVICAGTGPRREALEKLVADKGLTGSFRFLGVRNDLPAILAALDVFIFPSRFEGAGLVTVEAQAAGVPTLASNRVPPDVVLTPLMERMPLEAGAQAWADAALRLAASHPRLQRRPSDPAKWPFELGNSFNLLMDLYVRERARSALAKSLP